MTDTPGLESPKRRKPSVLRVLFRLFLLLLIGIGLGGGIFFGASYLSSQYFQAVQNNTENVDLLTNRIDQLEVQISTRLDDLVSRLDTLELQSDEQKITLADAQASVSNMETLSEEMTTRIKTLEAFSADQANTLSTQGSQITSLQTQTADLKNSLSETQTQLDDLEIRVTSLAGLLEERTLSASNYDSTLQQIKALVLLSRAQLYISQNNFGLAREDVQSSRDVIALLESSADTDAAAAYTPILIRLDSALLNLPGAPIAANADIESAWNALWARIETGLQAEPASALTPEPTEEP